MSPRIGRLKGSATLSYMATLPEYERMAYWESLSPHVRRKLKKLARNIGKGKAEAGASSASSSVSVPPIGTSLPPVMEEPARVVVGPVTSVAKRPSYVSSGPSVSTSIPTKIDSSGVYVPTTSAEGYSPASSTVKKAKSLPGGSYFDTGYDWMERENELRTPEEDVDMATTAAMYSPDAYSLSPAIDLSAQTAQMAVRTAQAPATYFGSYGIPWGSYGASILEATRSGVTAGSSGYYYQLLKDNSIMIVYSPKGDSSRVSPGSPAYPKIVADVRAHGGWNPIGKDDPIVKTKWTAPSAAASSSVTSASPSSAVVSKKYKGLNALFAALGGGDPQKGGAVAAQLAVQYGPGAADVVSEMVAARRDSPARIAKKIARYQVKYQQAKSRGDRAKMAKYAWKIQGLQARLNQLQQTGGSWNIFAPPTTPTGPVEPWTAGGGGGMPSWLPLAAVAGGLVLVLVVAMKK